MGKTSLTNRAARRTCLFFVALLLWSLSAGGYWACADGTPCDVCREAPSPASAHVGCADACLTFVADDDGDCRACCTLVAPAETGVRRAEAQSAQDASAPDLPAAPYLAVLPKLFARAAPPRAGPVRTPAPPLLPRPAPLSSRSSRAPPSCS